MGDAVQENTSYSTNVEIMLANRLRRWPAFKRHWSGVNKTINYCRGPLSEAVDGCICYTRKKQHGGDWERSRPQGPKNVHNFLMTVRPLS